MHAVEFQGVISGSGQISLPSEFARKIPCGAQLKVLVMWEPESEDEMWRSVGRNTFEAAYCDEDAVYDQLAHPRQA